MFFSHFSDRYILKLTLYLFRLKLLLNLNFPLFRTINRSFYILMMIKLVDIIIIIKFLKQLIIIWIIWCILNSKRFVFLSSLLNFHFLMNNSIDCIFSEVSIILYLHFVICLRIPIVFEWCCIVFCLSLRVLWITLEK